MVKGNPVFNKGKPLVDCFGLLRNAGVEGGAVFFCLSHTAAYKIPMRMTVR